MFLSSPLLGSFVQLYLSPSRPLVYLPLILIAPLYNTHVQATTTFSRELKVHTAQNTVTAR